MVNSSKEWGLELIFRHLWDKLGLDNILRCHFSKAHTSYELSEADYAMVLNRISDPLPKRGVGEWIDEIYRPGFSCLEQHHLYRAFDFLSDNKECVELELFERTKTLLDLQVDMVFWDTTSTYFEGKGPAGLAEYGYSKDNRPDRVQVMIGVVMTRQGIPIAHEVSPEIRRH